MSRLSSKSKPAKGKQTSAAPDVYVALLFVAVAALITGCIFLALELNEYDWGRPAAAASIAAPAERIEVA